MKVNQLKSIIMSPNSVTWDLIKYQKQFDVNKICIKIEQSLGCGDNNEYVSVASEK